MQLILQRLQGVKKILTMVGVGFQDDGLRVFEAAHAEDGLAVHDVAALPKLDRVGIAVGDVDQSVDIVLSLEGDVDGLHIRHPFRGSLSLRETRN